MVGEQLNFKSRSDLHRCFIGEGLGRFPGKWDINRGSVNQAGERKLSHKRAGTFSNINCPENIFEEQGEKASSHIHRQHDCPTLSSPQRGDKVKIVDCNSKKNLGFSLGKGDHDYCLLDPIN